MEPLVLALFLFYNAFGIAAGILLLFVTYKALTSLRTVSALPKKLISTLIIVVVLLTVQTVINYSIQNRYVARDKQTVRQSGLQIYQPQTSINGNKTKEVYMRGSTYVVAYDGDTLSELEESKMSDYSDLAGNSDCYLSETALANRNKERQQVIVTGSSNGTVIETPTNPDVEPIRNDCLSLGKTSQGIEVFVEKSRYNSGSTAYQALATIGPTFVLLKLDKRIDAAAILHYFENLTPTKTENVKFIDKSNRLLIANHF